MRRVISPLVLRMRPRVPEIGKGFATKRTTTPITQRIIMVIIAYPAGYGDSGI